MASANIPFFTSPVARAAWAHLDVKRTTNFENKPLALADQYYDVTLLIPKAANDSVQPPYLGPAVIVAKVWEAWCKLPGTNGQWKADAYWPVVDCDANAAWLAKHPFARGHWRISASSDYKPAGFDQGNNPLEVDMHGAFRNFKGGDYVLASINCYAYDKGKGGVNFGIEGFRKYADGDPIGGNQRSAEAMFGAAPAGAPPLPGGMPPAPQMGYGQPPQQQAYQPMQQQYAPPPAAPAPQYAPPPAAPAPQYAPQPPMSGQPVYGQQPAAYGAPPAYPPQGAAPAAPMAYPAPTPYGTPTPGSGPVAYPSSAPSAAPGYPPQGGPGMPPPPPLPPFGQR